MNKLDKHVKICKKKIFSIFLILVAFGILYLLLRSFIPLRWHINKCYPATMFTQDGSFVDTNCEITVNGTYIDYLFNDDIFEGSIESHPYTLSAQQPTKVYFLSGHCWGELCKEVPENSYGENVVALVGQRDKFEYIFIDNTSKEEQLDYIISAPATTESDAWEIFISLLDKRNPKS